MIHWAIQHGADLRLDPDRPPVGLLAEDERAAKRKRIRQLVLSGFAAAAVVGFLAERRQDRTPAAAIPAFLTATVVIYLFGVPWLSARLDVSWIRGMELGLAPFVIGDLAKALLAGLLLPLAWKLTGSAKQR